MEPVSGKRVIPAPRDEAPRRPCPHCVGQQALRATCGGGTMWLCQNLKCRRRDVVDEGDCPKLRAGSGLVIP